MGKRGPKPRPKGIHLLRAGDAPTTRTGPPLATDPPVMPEGLNPAEQGAWADLMTELAAVPGLVSRADRGVCELVARTVVSYRRAAEVVAREGSTLTVCDKDGHVRFVQTRPEAGYLVKLAALLKTTYSELGLTPSGRARVSVTPSAGPSKLDAFLGGHGA